jgi:hypothetical protein
MALHAWSGTSAEMQLEGTPGRQVTQAACGDACTGRFDSHSALASAR